MTIKEDDLEKLVDGILIKKDYCWVCGEYKVVNMANTCFDCDRFKMHLMK
jgi:hypothetical protein